MLLGASLNNVMTPILIIIPAIVLSLVVILTRSSLLPNLVSFLISKPPMLTHEFEEWLLTRRYGFFLHKLYTCSLCQAFHTSWISAATVSYMGASAEQSLGVVSFTFLIGLAYLNAVFNQPVVPQMTLESTRDNSTENISAEWPLPKKSFIARLKTSTVVDSSGGVSVDIQGMDPIATAATSILSRAEPCPHIAYLADVVAEFERELARSVDEKCPKCEEGKIRRRYLDYIVAALENDS